MFQSWGHSWVTWRRTRNGTDIDDAAIQGVKIGMGPLAGIGDPVFWFTVRPILLVLGKNTCSTVILLDHFSLLLDGMQSVMSFSFWYTQEFGYKAGFKSPKTCQWYLYTPTKELLSLVCSSTKFCTTLSTNSSTFQTPVEGATSSSQKVLLRWSNWRESSAVALSGLSLIAFNHKRFKVKLIDPRIDGTSPYFQSQSSLHSGWYRSSLLASCNLGETKKNQVYSILFIFNYSPRHPLTSRWTIGSRSFFCC